MALANIKLWGPVLGLATVRSSPATKPTQPASCQFWRCRQWLSRTTCPRTDVVRKRTSQAHARIVATSAQGSVYSHYVMEALGNSRLEAARQGSLFITPEHLLLGVSATSGLASRLLATWGLSHDQLSKILDAKVVLPVKVTLAPGDVDFNAACRELLADSLEAMRELGDDVVGTQHILLVLLDGENEFLVQALSNQKIAPADALRQVLKETENKKEGKPLVAPASFEQQAGMIQSEYKRLRQSSQPGQASAYPKDAPTLGASSSTNADDDIYE